MNYKIFKLAYCEKLFHIELTKSSHKRFDDAINILKIGRLLLVNNAEVGKKAEKVIIVNRFLAVNVIQHPVCGAIPHLYHQRSL